MALISKEDLLTKFETGALLFQPEVKRIIKIQPEVDAEPVRRGRWVRPEDAKAYDHDIFCSECGKLALSPSYWECDLEPSNYCPNCGAKMEVDDAD